MKTLNWNDDVRVRNGDIVKLGELSGGQGEIAPTTVEHTEGVTSYTFDANSFNKLYVLVEGTCSEVVNISGYSGSVLVRTYTLNSATQSLRYWLMKFEKYMLSKTNVSGSQYRYIGASMSDYIYNTAIDKYVISSKEFPSDFKMTIWGVRG